MVMSLLFFLLNGMGTLILETAWLKRQVVEFGTTPGSYGSILFAYFLGVSLGSWYFGRKDIARISKVRLYLALTASIAFSFLVLFCVPEILPVPRGFAQAHQSTYLFLKWTVAVVAILPSCFFLGAFLPLISKVVRIESTVLLYGVQTLGALVGVYLGALYLPFRLGYAMSFVVGGCMLVASLFFFHQAIRKRPQSEEGRLHPDATVYPLAFCSGFLTLSLQVLWIRFVAIGTDNSVYAFGSVSLIILAIITLSSYCVSRLPRRCFTDHRLLHAVMILSVVGIIASTARFISVTKALQIFGRPGRQGLGAAFSFSLLIICLGYVAPSFLFPSLLRTPSEAKDAKKGRGRGRTIGDLLAINGIGCALGSLLGTFVLLTYVGMWWTVLVCAAGYALAPVILAKEKWRRLSAIVLVAVVLVWNPLSYPLASVGKETPGGRSGKVISAAEGRYGIVSVIGTAGRFGESRAMYLNSHYRLEAGSDRSSSTRRMGLLPALLHPRAEKIAMIGLGTGIWNSGVLTSGAKDIVVIELIPEVVDAARRHFRKYNLSVLEDPRVRVVIDDGRHYLKNTDERYDLILSDLFVPWHEGTSYLYTAEHFQNAKDRLSRGGMFVLWLPMAQVTREEFLIIAKTFVSVFDRATLWQPHVTTGPDAILAIIGCEEFEVDEIETKYTPYDLNDPQRDIIEKGLPYLYSRYVGPLVADGPSLSGRPVNTLDRPVIEFLAARTGREKLVGKRFLNFTKEFFDIEHDAGSTFFSRFTERMEEYRRAGRLLNLAYYHNERGRGKLAADYNAQADRILKGR